MNKKYCIDTKDTSKMLFCIISENDNSVFVKGIYYRIYKQINKENVRYVSADEIDIYRRENDDYLKKLKENSFNRQVKSLLGTVLHIDGDEEYMQSCMDLYKEMKIHANGYFIEEKDMPKKIGKIVRCLMPDIVVITGHDFYNGEDIYALDSYKNTKYFMEACLEVKRNKSDCVIISGACQSNSEALILNGSNFASSPKRLNIHTYDPAIIAVKVASTSSERFVSKESLENKIDNFKDAYIGIETKGKMKILM